MAQELLSTRLAKENQKFFINHDEISGVQSVQAQYEVSTRPIKYLGMRTTALSQQGNQGGSVSVRTLLITEDPFINLTGAAGFNGYLLRARDNISGNFSFTSGFLTSYSNKCSIGQIPEISVGIMVVGNIGFFTSGESAAVASDFSAIATGVTDNPLMIAAPGAIDLSLDEFSTNRVLSYQIDINVPRNAIYALGTTVPVAVNINYPIEAVCSFQFEVAEYQASNLKKFKCSPKVQDIGITLKTFDTNEEVLGFNFENMTLIAESYTATTDGNALVNAKYKTLITR